MSVFLLCIFHFSPPAPRGPPRDELIHVRFSALHFSFFPTRTEGWSPFLDEQQKSTFLQRLDIQKLDGHYNVHLPDVSSVVLSGFQPQLDCYSRRLLGLEHVNVSNLFLVFGLFWD